MATALPWRDDKVDLDRYAEHVRWLIDSGCDGVVPNGSLGEYQVLTAVERAAVVRVGRGHREQGLAALDFYSSSRTVTFGGA